MFRLLIIIDGHRWGIGHKVFVPLP